MQLTGDVVVCSNHAQVQCTDVHLVNNLDALGVDKIVQRALYQLGKMI
jgi:hypothetical protein